jgi:uroporphyrinogen decarboxylase
MKRKDQLSSRERVRLALEHQETDRIPIAMVCSGINRPARGHFEAYLARKTGQDIATYLDSILDIRTVAAQYVGPALPPKVDIWGVRRKAVRFGLGEYDEIDHYPLAAAKTLGDLERHPWPSTALFDYSVLPESIKAVRSGGEYCLMASGGNPFETAWYMRGFERIFMDMVLNPELVHGLMRRVTDHYLAHCHAILSAASGGIDLFFTADDIAGQNGLLVSPEMWAKFIRPYHEELNRVIHGYGAKVIYHSDGAVMEAVPGLMEMGIDVLQALQFDAAGMDPAALKERHGDRLCFEGGVSVQRTLPFGTPEDVRAEVEHLIAVLGRNGGFILGPAHAIQAGTPPENIFTMFETALRCRPDSRGG